MDDIRHLVGINAPIEEVYEALATREGGTRWWTRDVHGDDGVGGKLEFRFGGPDRVVVMELAELTPPARVVWRCIQGPEEWLGTTITFDLRADGDETVVLSTHAGWREPAEFMHHCSTKWGTFLLSLKHGLEGAEGARWPDDVKVSSSGTEHGWPTSPSTAGRSSSSSPSPRRATSGHSSAPSRPASTPSTGLRRTRLAMPTTIATAGPLTSVASVRCSPLQRDEDRFRRRAVVGDRGPISSPGPRSARPWRRGDGEHPGAGRALHAPGRHQTPRRARGCRPRHSPSVGREVLFRVDPDRLDEATQAMVQLADDWDRRLQTIKRLAEAAHRAHQDAADRE